MIHIHKASVIHTNYLYKDNLTHWGLLIINAFKGID